MIIIQKKKKFLTLHYIGSKLSCSSKCPSFLTLTCLAIEHEPIARWTDTLVAPIGIFTLMLAGVCTFTFINICAERKQGT